MQLEFIPAQSPQPVAKYLASHITDQLEQSRSVLWLLSGGSCISVAVETAELLKSHDLTNLTVSLVDERYGPDNHADSNWQQLLDAGLDLPGATLHPVLTGQSQQATAEAFEAFLLHQFANTDYHLGLMGIGPDGHTSGILPHSPAVQAPGLVFAYDGGAFQRITTTAEALTHLSEAVVYVVGRQKWFLLDQLETDLTIAEQPAQALKLIRKVAVFTDRPQS